MSTLIADILSAFKRSARVLRSKREAEFVNGWGFERRPYSEVIFKNIVELLTDLANDVAFINAGGTNNLLFAELNRFYNNFGKLVLDILYDRGYAVICHNSAGFYLGIEGEDYAVKTKANGASVEALKINIDIYVMRSALYRERYVSDKVFLNPFLSFLDNVLSASATISKRLGTLVVCTPKNLTNAPTETILTEAQKNDLEQKIGKEYGALEGQKQIMLLPREMAFQPINLAGLDQRMGEKARLAILAIADRIKVPANQIAIIDANSSKSLANGTELREGDRNKYQSFERLLNQTFVQMFVDLGMKVDYTIYNKPLQA